MKYEPLALEITQNGGHKYKQVWRDEHAAVYEQRGAYGQLIGYEAIVIKRQKPKEIFGKHYSAKELYPTSEDWGTLAVSKNDLKEAISAAKKLAGRANAARAYALHKRNGKKP